MNKITIHNENCLATMGRMADNIIDAIVTDPPYGLSFMCKKWDADVPGMEIWRECLRVLKPGGHLLAFFGTRTYHRGVVNIEDAGFEIRDMAAWVHASGMPKGKDVSGKVGDGEWKTALKPAFEPIVLAQKPIDGTYAENVLKWGTGALNIGESRVGTYGARSNGSRPDKDGYTPNKVFGKLRAMEKQDYGKGRYPSNFIHDGSDEVLSLFPFTESGKMTSAHKRSKGNKIYGKFDMEYPLTDTIGDAGSAARFFYCAKASRAERGFGNNHPTVKPIALMEYLVRLVTPPGGTIYDPFMGSGTTLIAGSRGGFEAIGSELEKEYCDIARSRVGEFLVDIKIYDE